MCWTGTNCPSTPYTAPGKRLWLTWEQKHRWRFGFLESKHRKNHGNIERGCYLGPMGQDYDHAAVILRMVHLGQSRELLSDLLKGGVCLLA